jgi:hypothetical protein
MSATIVRRQRLKNMRKTRLSPIGNSVVTPGYDRLDLEHAAGVEVSSEAEGYPVEGALLKDVQPFDKPTTEVLNLDQNRWMNRTASPITTMAANSFMNHQYADLLSVSSA